MSVPQVYKQKPRPRNNWKGELVEVVDASAHLELLSFLKRWITSEGGGITQTEALEILDRHTLFVRVGSTIQADQDASQV